MLFNIYNSFRMEMNSGSILGYLLQAVPITLLVGIAYTIIRLVLLKNSKRHISWLSELMRLLFVCYLTGLCSLVILPANFWLQFFDGVFYGQWEYMDDIFCFGNVNLIPTVVKCFIGEYSLGSWVTEMLVVNIVMFIPFGFFLPFITEKLNRKRTFIVAVVVPFIVELLQLIVGRSFDIDDLICNFLGIAIGLLIAFGIKRFKNTSDSKQ